MKGKTSRVHTHILSKEQWMHVPDLRCVSRVGMNGKYLPSVAEAGRRDSRKQVNGTETTFLPIPLSLSLSSPTFGFPRLSRRRLICHHQLERVHNDFRDTRLGSLSNYCEQQLLLKAGTSDRFVRRNRRRETRATRSQTAHHLLRVVV